MPPTAESALLRAAPPAPVSPSCVEGRPAARPPAARRSRGSAEDALPRADRPPTADPAPGRAARAGRLALTGGLLALAVAGWAAAGVMGWELRQQQALIDAERATYDGVRQDMLEERIEEQRKWRAEKDELLEVHRRQLTEVEANFAERERIRAQDRKLELDKARLAGAEAVLAASKDPSGGKNPVLAELRKLKAEIEVQQASLREADRKLAEAMAQIDVLDKEKRKLARALDAAHLSVSEAEAKTSSAHLETRRAREKAIELEWERFALQSVQDTCWSGTRRRRTGCKETVERGLGAVKVEWLVCRLEQNTHPFLQTAPEDPAPSRNARLVLADGGSSVWLMLCDPSLSDRDAGDAAPPVPTPPSP
jgi:hypothetical protein